jgi:ribosomal protein S18 acetylase RimI-like enzyme
MSGNFQILPTTPNDDRQIAQHFYQMWLDNGIKPDEIQENWLEKTLIFINQARQNLEYQSFIAKVDSLIVGSVSCQLFSGLYPHILKETSRHYGYIWGVYVTPNYRHHGIGEKLTQQASHYLRSQGCTRVILHASPLGKPLYTRLGFQASNEMRLDLNTTDE